MHALQRALDRLGGRVRDMVLLRLGLVRVAAVLPGSLRKQRDLVVRCDRGAVRGVRLAARAKSGAVRPPGISDHSPWRDMRRPDDDVLRYLSSLTVADTQGEEGKAKIQAEVAARAPSAMNAAR